jgi:hypothetical protein
MVEPSLRTTVGGRVVGDSVAAVVEVDCEVESVLGEGARDVPDAACSC